MPQLSVLLAFHNQQNEIEETLEALYALKGISLEIIIVDDASTDDSKSVIRSVLDYHEHGNTFFFEHAHQRGRGASLNEALQEARGDIIWFPQSLKQVDRQGLQQCIKALKDKAAAGIGYEVELSMASEEWPKAICNNQLPVDSRFLWNRAHIPAREQFFSPFVQHHHAIEWILRGITPVHSSPDAFATSHIFESTARPSLADRNELLLTLMRQHPGNASLLSNLSTKLQPFSKSSAQAGAHHAESGAQSADHSQAEVAHAQTLTNEGKLTEALEAVDAILGDSPDHTEAKKLKIKLLERKRRFVEASELKHQIQYHTAAAHTSAEAPITTLVVPTAGHGKRPLEHCLLSIDAHCNPATTELIVIDNASLDDTHEYLAQLKEKNFFNCRIITNAKNNGVAASLNQGLQAANGRYVCIIHNDVEFTEPILTELEQRMDEHPAYGVMAPVSPHATYAHQQPDAARAGQKVVSVPHVESFCMMLRADLDVPFDENFAPAFFEDMDFCYQVQQQGHKVGVAPDTEITHHQGITTYALNLHPEGRLWWKNRAHLHKKWAINPIHTNELQSMGHFEQILALDGMVNPLFPEDSARQLFDQLFTDEVKTEIKNEQYPSEALPTLIHLLMVMEQREPMRMLEDRLPTEDLTPGLLYELVRFYYQRNIYSRCLHYLGILADEHQTLESHLYRLAILVDEKKVEEAVPLLKKLLDEAPANPELYKLAGDIYAFENEPQEAASFYGLAHQINPFAYSEDAREFQLRN